MHQEFGQHIFIGVSGTSLTSEEKKFIVENNIGGITLFGRNLESPEQVRNLCAEIQALRHQMKDRAPLFIGIDMEGGRVHRLKTPFTQWPALRKLGDLDSPTASFNFAYFMGLELRAVGINLNYAPCIDIFTNPKNTVIGDRSLGTNPEIVSKHASALIRGYMKADVVPCAKHFPGHGDTLIDSHYDLPVEQADLARLNQTELVPFKKAFRSRLDFLMTAHIYFPKIDPEWPATLSEIFLKKILREELRYRGFVITDDLGMKALAAKYPAELIPVRALQAGVDMLLYCNEPETPPIALTALEKALADKKLTMDQIRSSHQRILELKSQSLKNPDPPDFKSSQQVIGNSAHQNFSDAIARGELPSGLLGES
jgi:beta-N-acetylhexosaminidase